MSDETTTQANNEVASIGLLGECLVCGRKFKPWRDDYGELVTDECFACDQSRWIGSLMDRNLIG